MSSAESTRDGPRCDGGGMGFDILARVDKRVGEVIRLGGRTF